jgi:hypothetical protein
MIPLEDRAWSLISQRRLVKFDVAEVEDGSKDIQNACLLFRGEPNSFKTVLDLIPENLIVHRRDLCAVAKGEYFKVLDGFAFEEQSLEQIRLP